MGKAISIRGEEARLIAREFSAAKRNMVEAVKHLHAAGTLPRKKKDSLPHGEWLPWLEANYDVLGFSDRTAQKLMKFSNATLTADLDEAEAAKLTKELWGNPPPRLTKPDEEEEPEEESESEPEEVAKARGKAYMEASRKSYQEAFPGREMPEHWCGVTDPDELAWFDRFHYGEPEAKPPTTETSVTIALGIDAARSHYVLHIMAIADKRERHAEYHKLKLALAQADMAADHADARAEAERLTSPEPAAETT
jgi:DUF3102 family protein